MKPGHIKVFDGLRLTTEHVEHLQGSLHSALQEIRAILGLGRVYEGFITSALDGRQLTISPGLAFDQCGNRLVSEATKTLSASFPPGKAEQFVCLQYEQVEEGKVEGRSTMIWDSCAVLLRDTLPKPEENLLAIARVRKPATADGMLKVDNFTVAPAAAPAATMKSVTGAPPLTDSVQVVAESPLPSQGRPIRQGVLRLAAANNTETSLKAMVLEPLRTASMGEMNGGETELRLPLAVAEIELDFLPAGFSLHTLGKVHCRCNDTPDKAKEWQTQATAHGEATLNQGAVTQFGLATVHTTATDSPCPWAELIEDGVAHVPLCGTAKEPSLQLLLSLEPTQGSRVQAEVWLKWKGAVNTPSLQSLETQNLNFTWEFLAAWKALGN